jgi:predicted AlkP superfamily pyrophosphatase or phosphodiesterase
VSGRLHVFVLVDALGWRLLEGRDFLEDLLPHRQPLRTVLGYSSGAIPTLLTGRPPAEHGHWNLFYYDPEGSPFRWLRHLGFLPEAVLDNRLARGLLREAGRRALGLGPLFDCAVAPSLLPWFNWIEKRSLYAPGGVNGTPTIFDQLAAAGVPFQSYSYHGGSDANILRRARQDVSDSKARVFFLYLSELDGALHRHCQDREVVDGRLAWYAEELRAVFDAARVRDAAATLSIFSDHGMTPVRRHYDLVGAVEALGFRTPDDYLAVYDSTMARFWFFDDRARQAITALLASLPCGRIVDDAELQGLGILFPDRRYGELIALLDPGWLLASSGFNGSRWRPAGMHGYHPDDPDSDGVFLASEPPAVPVRSLADVHACLSEATV